MMGRQSSLWLVRGSSLQRPPSAAFTLVRRRYQHRLRWKNLGAWFDATFSMASHVTKTCGASFYHLQNIRCIRKYLSRDAEETLVHAFITSRVDYCNSLMYGLPAYQIGKVQRVQNAAARLVTCKFKYCRMTPLLKRLHWLPVRFRIQFKLLLVTFKAIHGIAPNYIKDLIVVRTPSKYGLRSNDSLLLRHPSFKSYKTLRDRSFAMAAPSLWNDLPEHLRDCGNITQFKALLRTYLVTMAFAPDWFFFIFLFLSSFIYIFFLFFYFFYFYILHFIIYFYF